MPLIAHAAVILSAALVFVVPLDTVNPDDLGVLGLASVLPVTVWIGLGMLLLGFAWAAVSRQSKWVLASYVVVTAVLLHGLPAFVYEFPRFPWAWKHVGIVDYIQRHNAVDPGISSMNAYHSWPGFFGLAALVTETGGLASPLPLVAWAPVFFNLTYIGALVFVFRSFTDRQAWIWTGIMFFTLSNWVGQDYFAPQAIAYLYYLLVAGILLRWYSKRGQRPGSTPMANSDVLIRSVLFVIMLAVVVSHQLTPVMAIVATAGLAWFGGVRLKWPPWIIGGLLLIWMVDFARPFTLEYVPKIIEDVGSLATRVNSGLIDYGQVDTGQRVVSQAARGLSVALGGLGVIGMLRLIKVHGFRWRPALVLLATPAVMVAASSYGNEILFRAFFFAAPMLALLAGGLWFARAPRTSMFAVGSLALVLMALTGVSVVAKHGNDVRTTFRAGEVQAATILYETAPPGSLVIQLSASSPIRFRNYENITEVAVEWYSDLAKARVKADAEDRFARWGIDGGYEATFVLLTKSQAAAISRLGRMPEGSYEAVEMSLRQSDRFSLFYQNDEAVIYELDLDEQD